MLFIYFFGGVIYNFVLDKPKDNIKEVHIQNDGLNLYGEYVDVGADRCVILLGGRCECLYYAYYYAKPYLENNCNVLLENCTLSQRYQAAVDGHEAARYHWRKLRRYGQDGVRSRNTDF